MKISILTPTYNRINTLENLYNSLLTNSKYNTELEWLIMDDGSTDNTKDLVENWIKDNEIEIKYFRQENQGKMTALNNLVPKSEGNIIIECDSDDYFTEDAFKIIAEKVEALEKNKELYALMFLKYDQDKNIIGNEFNENNHISKNFDLYFKGKLIGDKAIIFNSTIRKQYKHRLEKSEKFVTEARMYHEMDLKYNVICFNEPIMICEYRNDGYTQNIQKIFNKNPNGYYKYFKEMFSFSMKGVTLRKRLHIIKNLIVFYIKTKF